ncbi:hypothetical protein GGD81_000108 [Rhodobium orientis]|uniref:DUF1468 domain-containing protein n=1 Tax=Rhodobium orientis TaxID=34017 RepID=A0A327K3Z6_9HYPH|nr:tripartite tricarboxylate transporter TctB family protein [Rhodobium orientis]MBB4301093.1 hypothetical protein [Rhodobium orientis]MBK5949760.1 hypothetical protein [Rhodobium orientis]RAI30128.1 hypothetical protein CH339_00940 [Rhodobium orientis]
MPKTSRGIERLAGELVVPAIGLAFLAAYWWQAASLSFQAKVFPGLVSVSMLVLIVIRCVAIGREFFAQRQAAPVLAAGEATATPDGAWRGAVRRAALLVLATLMMVLWRDLGAMICIFLFLLGALLVLGERRIVLLVLLPGIMTVTLVYLFKTVLAAVFPAGIFSLF